MINTLSSGPLKRKWRFDLDLNPTFVSDYLLSHKFLLVQISDKPSICN